MHSPNAPNIALYTQQVAKHFKDVFAELVPGGRAELVMQTSAQARHADQENIDEGVETGRLDKYVGVKVKVYASLLVVLPILCSVFCQGREL